MDDFIFILIMALLPILIVIGLVIFIVSKSVERYNKNNPAFNQFRKNDICTITGMRCEGMTLWNASMRGNDCRKCMVPYNHDGKAEK